MSAGCSASRVRVWPVDDARGASTRCRVLAHVGALSAAGLDVRVRFPLGLGARGVLRRAARLADLLRDTRGALDADLLLIHRKTYPPPFARRLAGRGVPVVFDFDDALHLPPPGARGAAADPERYRRNFAATIGLARLAICGNRELAGHVGSTPHVVIPTAVDTGRFNPEAFPPPVGKTLGWVGHPDNLPDLEALAEPLAELGRRHAGLRLVVVSGRAPRLRGVNVEFRRWSLDTEVSCFSGIAVALAPLRDTPWTRAKCAYKLLQYMALGIPAVATGVGMVREVVEDGRNAALASSPGEWVEAIDTLLRDRDLAARMGAAGRQTVVDRYSLEAVSPRLVAALEGALADRRAPSR